MATEIPRCPNSRPGNGCTMSDVKIEKETEEFWSFRCQSCKCLFAVSKEGVRNRSKFENAAKRRQEELERVKRWESRKRIFS